MNGTNSKWVCARDAIEKTGVKRRTLYAWIEAGRVPSRNIDGLTHIDLAAVQECMQVHSARTHPADSRNVAQSAPLARLSRFSPEDAARLSAKRAQVDSLELDRAATEANDSLLEAQVNSVLAANSRQSRLAGAELATIRERLELEQLQWRQHEERRQAARQRAARESEQQRRIKAEAQAAEEQRQLKAREQEYVLDAVAWARHTLGDSAILPATQCVRRVLAEFDLDAPEAIVAATVSAELEEIFGARIEAKQKRALELARLEVRGKILETVMHPRDAGDVRTAVEEALDSELATSTSPRNDMQRLAGIAAQVRQTAVTRREMELLVTAVTRLAARNL